MYTSFHTYLRWGVRGVDGWELDQPPARALGRGASLRCSFVEVRGDEINDLLGHGRHLRVRESYLRGAHVPDAAERARVRVQRPPR